MPESGARAAVARPLSSWVGQLLLYGLFALCIGVFSQWPVYRHLGADEALIKVSFTHAGKPVADCVSLSAAELARLPPNMRAPTKCPRERSPVTVAVDIDGVNVLTRSASPSGLSKDGASAVYQRLVVPAREQRVTVRLSDDVRARDAAYRRETTVSLSPGQVLVIDFDAEKGGITFR